MISAVGHETDFTIADLVADVRAPTPSAAAEIAVAEKANLLRHLASLEKLSRHRIEQQIGHYRQRVSALKKHPLLSSPYGILAEPIQRLDDFARGLQRVNPSARIKEGRERLRWVTGHLNSLNPQNLLKKGYAILFSENGDSIILSAKELAPNQKFSALLHDGKVAATVNQVVENGTGNTFLREGF